MAKPHSFRQKFALAFKDENSKFVHLKHNFVIEHFSKRSEIRENFLNVMMEKDGDGQLDRSYKH
jgi:hypothetical protein